MPCIASRGHSVIDSLLMPSPCACNRDAAAIVLIDLHGKWKSRLYATQLQCRFRWLVITVMFAQLALTEPCTYPIGRTAQQRLERAFDGGVSHHSIRFQPGLSCSGSNRIIDAVQAVYEPVFHGLLATPYTPLPNTIHLCFG